MLRRILASRLNDGEGGVLCTVNDLDIFYRILPGVGSSSGFVSLGVSLPWTRVGRTSYQARFFPAIKYWRCDPRGRRQILHRFRPQVEGLFHCLPHFLFDQGLLNLPEF
jgi:hypothetical protein